MPGHESASGDTDRAFMSNDPGGRTIRAEKPEASLPDDTSSTTAVADLHSSSGIGERSCLFLRQRSSRRRADFMRVGSFVGCDVVIFIGCPPGASSAHSPTAEPYRRPQSGSCSLAERIMSLSGENVGGMENDLEIVSGQSELTNSSVADYVAC